MRRAWYRVLGLGALLVLSVACSSAGDVVPDDSQPWADAGGEADLVTGGSDAGVDLRRGDDRGRAETEVATDALEEIRAEDGTLHGVVRGTAGEALEGAVVEVMEDGIFPVEVALSGGDGGYRMTFTRVGAPEPDVTVDLDVVRDGLIVSEAAVAAILEPPRDLSPGRYRPSRTRFSSGQWRCFWSRCTSKISTISRMAFDPGARPIMPWKP